MGADAGVLSCLASRRCHASSVMWRWPIPIGRPSRRAGAPGCPPASRYDLTRRLSYRGRTRARGLVRPSSRVAPGNAPAGPRWLPRARRDAHERRILAPPRLPGSRATAPRPVSTPRPRRGYGAYGRARRAGRWRLERFRLYRSIYTLSRSRRSNMQPARDHLNSITVVCASPRRAAPLRLHRPHVARVYRTTGDHRTHYLIKSRSEPKRPPRG